MNKYRNKPNFFPQLFSVIDTNYSGTTKNGVEYFNIFEKITATIIKVCSTYKIYELIFESEPRKSDRSRSMRYYCW